MIATEGKDILSIHHRVFPESNSERIGFLEMIVEGNIHGNDEESKIAAQSVRQWYEDPSKMPYQRMFARISESQWKSVFYNFKDCLMVLKEHRLEELFGQYEEALKQRNHDKVNSTEMLIKGFDDKEAIEKMNNLKKEYIQTRRYKPPKPEGEVSWGYILGVGAAAAIIITIATFAAMSEYKPVQREQRVEKPQLKEEYLATPR